MGIELPWSPRTRQQQGMSSEKQMARKHGAKVHPRSGAGRIKADASTDDTVYEYKDASRTHTLKADELDLLLSRAIQQGKDAHYVVYFGHTDVTADITLRRGKG